MRPFAEMLGLRTAREPAVTCVRRWSAISMRKIWYSPLTPVSKYSERPSPDHCRSVGMRSSEGKGAVVTPPPTGAIMICGGASSAAAVTYAIDFPSGDQRGELSGPSAAEIFVGAPPSALIVHTSVLRPPSYSCPVRSETNAMRAPSGDHCGSVSFQSSPSVI